MNKDKKVVKKEGSTKALSPRDADPKTSAVKATRRKLISGKLKKFLSARPSHDELYDRKILPYGTTAIPLKMSIFNKIVLAFENANAINSEGIFRISGNSENIRNLTNGLTTSTDFSGASPHDIAGVLKLYIRELPQPLVPLEHFQALLDSQRLEKPQSTVYVQKVVQLMPEENKQVLKALIALLEKVTLNNAVNKMTVHNISVCFGPNVLRSPKDGADVLNEIETQCSVVACMIENRASIFGDPQPQTMAVPLVPPRPHGNTNPPPPLNVNTSPPQTNGLPPPLNLPPPAVFSPPIPPPITNLPPLAPPDALPSRASRRLTFNLPPPPPPPTQPTQQPKKNSKLKITRRPTPQLHPVGPLSAVVEPPPDYDALQMSLIDDLCEEDKSTLAQKLAYYFNSEGDQFKNFLRDVVGIEGVIALLESVV